MKLADIKQRMKEVSPFLTLQFFGKDNCLSIGTPAVPISICLIPPSISFIIESGHMTTLILRYSETYKNEVAKAQNIEESKKLEFVRQVMSQVTENITTNAEEQAKQLSIVSRLGREFLIAKSVYGYYGDESDRFKVVFHNDKEMVDTINAESGDEELAILVDALDDMELFSVGMQLMSALPLDQEPNIPFIDTEAKQGEAKEEVVSSVPASRVASFPRSTRGVIMEDVPSPSGSGIGDKFD